MDAIGRKPLGTLDKELKTVEKNRQCVPRGPDRLLERILLMICSSGSEVVIKSKSYSVLYGWLCEDGGDSRNVIFISISQSHKGKKRLHSKTTDN